MNKRISEDINKVINEKIFWRLMIKVESEINEDLHDDISLIMDKKLNIRRWYE